MDDNLDETITKKTTKPRPRFVIVGRDMDVMIAFKVLAAEGYDVERIIMDGEESEVALPTITQQPNLPNIHTTSRSGPHGYRMPEPNKWMKRRNRI